MTMMLSEAWQMRQTAADPYEVASVWRVWPISINSVFSALKLCRDTTGVHEGAALWLLHFLMKHHAVEALNASIELKAKSNNPQKEGTVTLYLTP